MLKPSASLLGEMLTTLLIAFLSFTLYVALARARYRLAALRDAAALAEEE